MPAPHYIGIIIAPIFVCVIADFAVHNTDNLSFCCLDSHHIKYVVLANCFLDRTEFTVNGYADMDVAAYAYS